MTNDKEDFEKWFASMHGVYWRKQLINYCEAYANQQREEIIKLIEKEISESLDKSDNTYWGEKYTILNKQLTEAYNDGIRKAIHLLNNLND